MVVQCSDVIEMLAEHPIEALTMGTVVMNCHGPRRPRKCCPMNTSIDSTVEDTKIDLHKNSEDLKSQVLYTCRHWRLRVRYRNRTTHMIHPAMEHEIQE